MNRRKAFESRRRHWDLLISHAHGAIDRRTFLRSARRLAGGVAAGALVGIVRPNDACAVQVPENDRRIRSDYVYIASPQGHGAFNAYLAFMNTPGKGPGVLVCTRTAGL